MEIVNLVRLTIHRLGTAKTGYFGSNSGSTFEIKIESIATDPETLKGFVILHAREMGDDGPFDTMKQIPSHIPSEVRFDIQSGNVQHSQHYATCRVITALKADGRYFKLEEVT